MSTSDGTFDVAAGADQATLNTITASVYAALYPQVFKGTLPVNSQGIASVTYDIQQAPTITVGPSSAFQDYAREHFREEIPAEEVEKAVLAATQASFTVGFPAAALTISYTNGQSTPVPACSASAAAQAIVNANGTLSLQLITNLGVITVPNEPILSSLLTNAFAPQFLAYLNSNLLSAVTIPSLSFNDVTLSLPALTTEGTTLVGYSALSPSSSVPPSPGTAWPSGMAFVSADETILAAVADSALSELDIQGSYDNSWNVALCTLKVDANYDVSAGGVSLTLQPGTGNIIKGSGSLSASVSASAACGIFSTGLSGSATGSLDLTMAVSAPGNEVVVTFIAVDNVDVTVSLDGVPSWLEGILSSVLSGIGDAIAAVVTAELQGLQFSVFQIPEIDFSAGGLSLAIQLEGLQLQTISGPNEVPMLTVTGLASVHEQAVGQEKAA